MRLLIVNTNIHTIIRSHSVSSSINVNTSPVTQHTAKANRKANLNRGLNGSAKFKPTVANIKENIAYRSQFPIGLM